MKKLNVILISLLLIFLGSSGKVLSQEETKYQVAAKDGAWCWFADPRAVYYKGEQRRIYYGYINSSGDVLISARDLKSKKTETFVLHEKLQVDDHNVPSILFLPDGKILTFYTEHGGRFFMRKSKFAEEINEWEEERVLSFGMGDKRLCYSHPVMLSGEADRIYLFYRGQQTGKNYSGWGQYFTFSDDGGKTWADGKYLINSEGFDNPVYLKVSSDNDARIDVLFTDGHPKIGPASVYHMYYEEGIFYQTNGESIAGIRELPIAPDQVNKVYDVNKSGIKSWIWDINLDKNQRPVVAYTQYPEETDHRYHYARWNGKQWLDEEITQAGGMITVLEPGETIREAHYSGGVVLDPGNPSNVFLARQVRGIFEIEHWRKKRKQWKTRSLTRDSPISNLRPYVVAHNPKRKPIVLWMKGLYKHYTQFKTELLINERQTKSGY